MVRLLSALGFLSLCSCASTSVYDLSKVQQNLSTALLRSDEVTQKAQADYADKKTLVENLGKAGATGFRDFEPQLRTYLGAMEASLDRIALERKKRMTASSNVASLSYGHQSLSSRSPGFEKVEEEVKDFQDATAAGNLAMADYSRTSNALTDLIAAKKLYMTFESAQFFKNLQRNVKLAQENSTDMQKEISRAQRADRGDPASLETLAQDYTVKAQRLSAIGKEMRGVTGDARVTSLDPRWPEVQTLINENDRLTREMEAINQKFLKGVEELRANQKRSRQ